MEASHKPEYSKLKSLETDHSIQLSIIIDSTNNLGKYRKPPTDDQINRTIAEFIAIDTQPYSVVEDQGFQNLIQLTFPNRKLHKRQWYTELITKIYDE